MAVDSTKVRVGVTGGVYVDDGDTPTLPTDALTARDAGFLDVGFISEDGVTESHSSSSNKIKAWQNAAVVRTVQTEHDYTLSFTMIETNAVSLKQFYGDYDLTAGLTTVEVTGALPGRAAWVLEVIDGDEHLRIVLPTAEITERGDVNYQNANETGYQVTLTCYPDTNGVKAYIYRETEA